METTTLKKGNIGMVLSFNEAHYLAAINAAENFILPILQSLIQTYNELGLSTKLDQETLNELFNSGTAKMKEKLDKLTKADMPTFKSPVAQRMALESVEIYFDKLEASLLDFKEKLKNFNRSQTSYRFVEKDLLIEDGVALINKDPIEKHFTKTIESEYQLELYNQLILLADQYNKIIELIKTHGGYIPMDSSQSLTGTYLKKEKIANSDFLFSDTVQVNIQAL